jgi:hypothetical protein
MLVTSVVIIVKLRHRGCIHSLSNFICNFTIVNIIYLRLYFWTHARTSSTSITIRNHISLIRAWKTEKIQTNRFNNQIFVNIISEICEHVIG